MGWVAVVAFAVIVLGLIWFLLDVVRPLTHPTTLTNQIGEFLVKRLEQDQNQETLRLLMGLENAASGIRLATLQVALATLGGFLLVVVGVLLFAIGASGVFSAKVEGGETSVTITDLTPGIACAIIGSVLIGIGAYRDVRPPNIEYASPPSPSNGSLGGRKIETILNRIEGSSTIPPDSKYAKPHQHTKEQEKASTYTP